jgi:uncharacterized DUF497 family protein
VEITYDPAKNLRNIALRGLNFERVVDFDFLDATYLIDDRREYPETRRIAIGYLEGRLHHLCFVEIATGIRVVSFRKANAREAKRHGKAKEID